MTSVDSIAGFTKVCTKCGEEKELEFFSESPSGKLGRRESCKPCRAANQHIRRYGIKIAGDVELRKGRLKTIRQSQISRYGIDVVEFMDEVGMTESRNDLDDFAHPDGRTFSGGFSE